MDPLVIAVIGLAAWVVILYLKLSFLEGRLDSQTEKIGWLLNNAVETIDIIKSQNGVMEELYNRATRSKS